MTDLTLATEAALAAGNLLRQHFGSVAVVDEATHHDIKLALDKESQHLITDILLGNRPGDALYGEEGLAGNQQSLVGEWFGTWRAWVSRTLRNAAPAGCSPASAGALTARCRVSRSPTRSHWRRHCR